MLVQRNNGRSEVAVPQSVKEQQWAVVFPHTLLITDFLLVLQDLAECLQLVLLIIRRHELRYVGTQSVSLLARVETLRMPFPLDKDLKLSFYNATGHQPSNKNMFVATLIHQRR